MTTRVQPIDLINAAKPRFAFLEPFRLPDFTWTWTSVLLANTGRYGVVLVGGDEAFRTTHSSLWSSLVVMLLLAPTLVFGPIAGALADRHSRKLIMRLACGVAVVGCLGGALIRGSASVRLGVVVGAAMIVGSAQSLFAPSWQALIPNILGERKLLAGGGFTRVAMQGGEFVGPLAVTPIVAILGIKPGFVFCAAAYAIAGALTLRLSTPERPVTEPATVLHRVVEGVTYIRRNRRLAGVLTLTGFHCALTMAFLGMLPALAAGQLNDTSAYGPLVTTLGLGAIIGAFAVALFSRRLQSAPLLVVSGAASGVLLVALAAASSYRVALAFAFLASAAQAAFMSGSYSVIQTLTADHLRGRVSSVSNMLNAGSMGLLGLGWGAIADATSVPIVLGLLGASFVVVVGVYLATFPPLRTLGGLEHQIAIPAIHPDVAM